MTSSLVAQLLPLALLLGGQGGTVQTPVVPVPSATLEEAVSMFHSGNHAQSVALLKRLQVGELKAPEATAVKHLLGRNFVSLGHYDEAIESLLSALKDARRPGRTRLTDHLRWSLAQAYEGKGEHLLAARAYGIISRDRLTHLSSEAMFRRAGALSNADKIGGERRVLEGFTEIYPDSPHIWDAKARLGEIKARIRDHDAALSLFRRVIRYARTGDAVRIAKRGLTALGEAGVRGALGDSWADRLDDLEWLVDERRFQEAIPQLEAYHRGAKASRQHGRALRARELLARSFRETGHAEAALTLYDELAALGRFPTSQARIVHLHAVRGEFKTAESVLLASHGKRKTRAYWRDLGHLRMEFGRYKEAEKALRRAVAGRSRRSTDSLWQDITWCAVRTGQTERALKLLDQVAARQPKRSVWARYWQARTLQDAGKLTQAKERFERLEKQDPFSYYGLMAWSRLKDITQMALVAEQAPLQETRSEDGPTAQSSESDETPPATRALSPFQQVPEVPRTYPPLSPPVAQLPPLPVQNLGPATLVASLGPVAQNATEGEIGPTLEDAGLVPEIRGTLAWPMHMRRFEPEMAFVPASRLERLERLEALAGPWGKVVPQAQRALELERLGFTDLATNELRVVETDVRTLRRHGWKSLVRRGRSDMLDNRRQKKGRGGAKIKHLGRRTTAEARAFKRAHSDVNFKKALRDARIALGDPHASRKRALERGRLSGPADRIDLNRWRTAYPLPWMPQVASACELFDVPPAFIYGIMTVESAYHAHAVSISHAYGSLQMIPRTGRRVSAELKLPSFAPERLLEADYGIPMGTQYMGRLLDRFHHQEPLAAAAYNAGPHRVAKWLKSNPNRPLDVFIEEIPFRQARGYAKSVLRHTARIRHIYYGEDRMYVPNTLIAAHTEQPNY